MLQKVVLGLGSNIGRREIYLKKAIKEISLLWNFLFLDKSKIYESEPWGFKNQNNFLNCIIAGLYRRTPVLLLSEIKEIEMKIGRKNREKWHPREIDIDILFFGNEILKRNDLIIPHPQIINRNFVLKPLAEIMPDFVHPVFKKDMVTLLKNSSDDCKVFLNKKQIF